MTPKYLFFNLLLFVCYTAQSQNESLRFDTYSLGLGNGNLRDFGTSPLVYRGSSLHLAASKSKYVDNKWREYGIAFLFGDFENKFNGHSATSQLNQFTAYYSKLYPLRWGNNSKTTYHAGGLFKMDINLRNNPALGNSEVGIEGFPTLFGSVQATTDISRKETKNKKIWFIPYRLLPVQRALSLRFNLGLANAVFRNPYSYLPHSALRNTGGYFDDYELLFSGFRLRSEVHYDWILSNKNRMRMSYTWELWTTSKHKPNRFEMAQHRLRFTYLFHIPIRQ